MGRKIRIWCLLLFFMFCASGVVTCHTTQEVEAATTTGFVTVNGKTYYYKNGTKVTGWLTLNGKKYYFSKSTGVMVTGWVKTSSGYRYFSKTDGHMFTGWVKTSSGYRYFSKSTGYMFTGWVKTSTGYRYFSKSTGYMYTGWVKNSSGNYRFFNRSTGYMYTGWMTTSSGKRYFNKSNGIMLTGWNSSKTRYFHASNGIMYTGLKKIGSYYYYFNTSTGVMLTSTSVTVSGVTYTISSSGVCTETATVTTATSTGTKTIKNYLAGAISPVGQVLYVWGGGWNNSTTIGIPSTMISFYNSQSADYDYTDYMDLSTSTRAKGFDCSGFVGWAAYQVMRSGSGYTVTAENVGSYYKSLGWGSLVSQSKLASTDYKLYAGDVGYNSGHTWIVVGQCSDSSIVIVHSTPNAGVQLSGTPTPSGDYSSEAITLAKKYMSKYSGYTKYSYHTSSGNYIKNGAYFRWSSSTLSDPDGYKSMTASQILADLYS